MSVGKGVGKGRGVFAGGQGSDGPTFDSPPGGSVGRGRGRGGKGTGFEGGYGGGMSGSAGGDGRGGRGGRGRGRGKGKGRGELSPSSPPRPSPRASTAQRAPGTVEKYLGDYFDEDEANYCNGHGNELLDPLAANNSPRGAQRSSLLAQRLESQQGRSAATGLFSSAISPKLSPGFDDKAAVQQRALADRDAVAAAAARVQEKEATAAAGVREQELQWEGHAQRQSGENPNQLHRPGQDQAGSEFVFEVTMLDNSADDLENEDSKFFFTEATATALGVTPSRVKILSIDVDTPSRCRVVAAVEDVLSAAAAEALGAQVSASSELL